MAAWTVPVGQHWLDGGNIIYTDDCNICKHRHKDACNSIYRSSMIIGPTVARSHAYMLALANQMPVSNVPNIRTDIRTDWNILRIKDTAQSITLNLVIIIILQLLHIHCTLHLGTGKHLLSCAHTYIPHPCSNIIILV